jgi:hypothetical protein
MEADARPIEQTEFGIKKGEIGVIAPGRQRRIGDCAFAVTTRLNVDTTADPSSPTSQTITFNGTWPHQNQFLTWCQHLAPGEAALLIIAGIVYLLWGYAIFKVLIMLNAAVVGAVIGSIIGQSGDQQMLGAAIGAVGMGALAWPLMKHAVAFMGGIYGFILGGSLWQSANLDPRFFWAGALLGLIAFGLISFIVFRGSVMMYTSLQGASMIVVGVLGLLFKYKDMTPRVVHHMTLQPMLLPALILVPALIGIIYQQHTAKSSEK